MTEITIEGPGKNALGTAQMSALIDAIRAADGGPLLVKGEGDAFSAGLNLKEVHAADTEGMKRFLTRLTDLCVAIHHHPGPTVAAVNGHAIAGGCLVALLCDVRVCTSDPKARIGLNEVALGLRFPPRIFRLARSRMSPAHDSEILLGAGLHAPKDAQRLGLVDHVVDDPIESARQALRALASHPADAYGAAKRDLRAAADAPDPVGDARFESEVLPVWSGPELKARIAAFLKR